MTLTKGQEMRPDIGKLEDWASYTLKWASEILDANPPGSPNKDIRVEALLAIDDVLHIGAASELRSVQQFYESRMSRAIHQIGSEQVDSGIMVWKMYNHGFVIKTGNGTIGSDLIRGYRGTTMSDGLAGELARQIDVTTISHWHRDHADIELCRNISGFGGEILVPPDLFERWSPESGLKLINMEPGSRHDAGIAKFESIEGHHDGPPDGCNLNMYYILTEAGISVMHMGDHWINRRMPLSPEDEKSVDDLGNQYHVDVLLINRSPYQFANIIGRIKPRIAISSHENELSHDIAARATYLSSIEQMVSIERPCFTMAWGESLSVK